MVKKYLEIEMNGIWHKMILHAHRLSGIIARYLRSIVYDIEHYVEL